MSPASGSTISATFGASRSASSWRYGFSMSMTNTAASLIGSCIPRYVFGQPLGMDFYSAYHQGFVRVAACTHHTAIADPAANAESVLRVARTCHDDSVALAVFPELTLSGYSIEDILLQDALLDTVEDALLDVVVAAADTVHGAIRMGEADVPFGPDLLFTATDLPSFVLHVEICEDMFVPIPPSAQAALAGATVLANLSGS